MVYMQCLCCIVVAHMANPLLDHHKNMIYSAYDVHDVNTLYGFVYILLQKQISVWAWVIAFPMMLKGECANMTNFGAYSGYILVIIYLYMGVNTYTAVTNRWIYDSVHIESYLRGEQHRSSIIDQVKAEDIYIYIWWRDEWNIHTN